MKREGKIPGLGLTPAELKRARDFRAKPYQRNVLERGGENLEYEPPPPPDSQQIIVNVQINVNQTFNYYNDNRQLDNRQVNIDNRKVIFEEKKANEIQKLLDL